MEGDTFVPEDLSELIGLVYDSAFEPQQWRSLVERITQLFPGIGAMVYGIDGDVMLPEYTCIGLPHFFAEPITIDLGLVDGISAGDAWRTLPNGFVSRTREFMDEQAYLATELYQNVLKPAGFRHAINLKLDARGRRSAAIGFGIPEDPAAQARLHDPLFELLKILSPHAVRALRLSRSLAMAKRSTEVFSGFLDGIILPMLVTDSRGKFLFGNATGQRVLKRGSPLSLNDSGQIVLEDNDNNQELIKKIADVDRDLAPGGLRILAEPAPILLLITPFRASMSEGNAMDRHLHRNEGMFAIFIGQTETDAISTALLEDVFDLTPREAEVCKSLMLGESAAEIAEASGTSLKTVRNQIQVVHEKVSVTSNVALIDALSVFRTVGSLLDNQEPAVQPLEL